MIGLRLAVLASGADSSPAPSRRQSAEPDVETALKVRLACPDALDQVPPEPALCVSKTGIRATVATCFPRQFPAGFGGIYALSLKAQHRMTLEEMSMSPLGGISSSSGSSGSNRIYSQTVQDHLGTEAIAACR